MKKIYIKQLRYMWIDINIKGNFVNLKFGER